MHIIFRFIALRLNLIWIGLDVNLHNVYVDSEWMIMEDLASGRTTQKKKKKKKKSIGRHPAMCKALYSACKYEYGYQSRRYES